MRAELEAAGWETTRLAWMRHTEPLPGRAEVETIRSRCSICARLPMRRRIHEPPHELPRERARGRDDPLGAGDRRSASDGELVGFAQLERDGGGRRDRPRSTCVPSTAAAAAERR